MYISQRMRKAAYLAEAAAEMTKVKSPRDGLIHKPAHMRREVILPTHGSAELQSSPVPSSSGRPFVFSDYVV